MKKQYLLYSLLFLFFSQLHAQNLKEKIDKLIVPLIKNEWNVGVVVGIYQKGKPNYIFSYGVADKKESQVLNQNTTFEIGSISKVFTSIMLLKLAQQKKLQLSDPVNKFLPINLQYKDSKVTLTHLATHTSALPRMPLNIQMKNPNNPYNDYTIKQFDDFLKNYKIQSMPGKTYAYSNLGMGLLGRILSEHEKKTYEDLIVSEICAPLGMNSTFIKVSPEKKKRLAQGHNADGKEVSQWDLPTLAGCGAIRSNVNDLLKFIQVNIAAQKSDKKNLLQQALMLATKKQKNIAPKLDIAFGWHIKEDKLFWHNGATGGFNSFIAFDPNKETGVVVLSNISLTVSKNNADNIGGNILRILFDAPTPPRVIRKKIDITSKNCTDYVGKYYFNFGGMDITCKDNKLFAQMSSQPSFRVYPESQKKFFYKIVDAQLEFVRDKEGKVEKLILFQNGTKFIAVKLK